MTDHEELIERINSASFTLVRTRSSYDMTHVDDFLDALVVALQQGRPVEPLVDMVRFSTTRFRDGYDSREVDRFLDQVVADSQLLTPQAGRADTAGVPPPNPSHHNAAPEPVAPEGTAGGDGTASSEEAWARPSVIEERRGLLSRLFQR